MKSSGDNSGDSKIPLDQGFRVRESNHSYRRAHANRGRETEPHTSDLRVGKERRRVWSTRRSGAGRGEKPQALRTGTRRATVGGWGEVPGRRRTSTPTAREARVRAALVRWHGLPGQRERRRGPTDRATGDRGPAPATEVGSPAAEVGGPSATEVGSPTAEVEAAP